MSRIIKCGSRPLTAIILAGGRGLRMKSEKATLRLSGERLLDLIVRKLKPFFKETIISVSPNQKIAFPPALVIKDEITGLGPIGGLVSGLKAASYEKCFVLACDMPEINISIIRRLAKKASRAEIVVPVNSRGFFEPLFAVYSKSIIPAIEELLRSGNRGLIPLFDRAETCFVEMKDTDWFWNLNTKEDVVRYNKFLKEKAGKKTC